MLVAILAAFTFSVLMTVLAAFTFGVLMTVLAAFTFGVLVTVLAAFTFSMLVTVLAVTAFASAVVVVPTTGALFAVLSHLVGPRMKPRDTDGGAVDVTLHDNVRLILVKVVVPLLENLFALLNAFDIVDSHLDQHGKPPMR